MGRARVRGTDSDETTAAVSEAVSRLFLDKFGKGPVHAETYVNGDVAVTLMRDVFTWPSAR